MENVNSLAVIVGALLVLAAGIYFVSSNKDSQPYANPASPEMTESPTIIPTPIQAPQTNSPVPTPTISFPAIGEEDIARLKNASSYHPLLWPNHTARWARMPLKVFLNTTREKYLADYQRAAETWKNGTNGIVSFTTVNSSREADITFIWIETVLSDEGNRLGWTEPMAISAGDFYIIKRATITMRVEAGPCDADTSIINVVAHELGHALGLGHETRYNQDLMKEQLKCQFYELPAISENAKMALEELYRIPKIDHG